MPGPHERTEGLTLSLTPVPCPQGSAGTHSTVTRGVQGGEMMDPPTPSGDS